MAGGGTGGTNGAVQQPAQTQSPFGKSLFSSTPEVNNAGFQNQNPFAQRQSYWPDANTNAPYTGNLVSRYGKEPAPPPTPYPAGLSGMQPSEAQQGMTYERAVGLNMQQNLKPPHVQAQIDAAIAAGPTEPARGPQGSGMAAQPIPPYGMQSYGMMSRMPYGMMSPMPYGMPMGGYGMMGGFPMWGGMGGYGMPMGGYGMPMGGYGMPMGGYGMMGGQPSTAPYGLRSAGELENAQLQAQTQYQAQLANNSALPPRGISTTDRTAPAFNQLLGVGRFL